MEKEFLFGEVVVGILLLIGIGAVAVFYNFPEAIAGDSLFAKPDWARLECSPTDAYEGKNIKWLDEQTLFKCDANTEECRFKVEDSPSLSCLGFGAIREYRICDLDGNNCGARQNIYSSKICGGISTDYIFIPNGKSVKFSSGASFANEDATKVTFEWKPWKVYRFVGGSKSILNSQDCRITSNMKERIRQEDNVDTLYRTGGEGQKWVNYVNDWVYGPATNIYDYQGQKAYCTNGAVYSIVELQMANGNLVQINPEYSDTTESGDKINGLGNKISNVECCPNEPTCTENFEYVKADSPELVDEQKECFTDLQCFNAGGFVPQTQTTYSIYQCIQNKCIKSAPITVECTTNSACGNGQICDLSTTNYGKCITQSTGEYCGDGICQITESKNICQADCSLGETKECPFGQTYKEEQKGLFGTSFLGKQAGCYTSSWVIVSIISGFVVLLIFLIFLIARLTRM